MNKSNIKGKSLALVGLGTLATLGSSFADVTLPAAYTTAMTDGATLAAAAGAALLGLVVAIGVAKVVIKVVRRFF